MAKKVLAEFKVEYLQVMDEEGKADETLMPDLKPEKIKEMYFFMNFARALDEKFLKLQRTGRSGTFASLKGQEAAQIGSAFALNKEDWAVPSYREHGVFLVRGAAPEWLIAYVQGDERGDKIPEGQNDLCISIPVGSQPLHAVGLGYAIKYKNEKAAVITFFGDGATSEGETLEAMNFAGVWKAPVVFLNQNNQWAISTPRKNQTAAETIAQKAIAFGFTGIQVDGNDVFAVYRTVKEALDKARNGGGPTLIECITYRLSDHTTADDATKYRTPEEVAEWKKKDPIDRLRKFMEGKGFWSEEDERKLSEDIEKRVSEAVEKAENIPKPSPEEMFDNLYEKIPKRLQEQKEKFMNELKETGEWS